MTMNIINWYLERFSVEVRHIRMSKTERAS